MQRNVILLGLIILILVSLLLMMNIQSYEDFHNFCSACYKGNTYRCLEGVSTASEEDKLILKALYKSSTGKDLPE